jgi:hypothetical protein
MPKNSIAVVRTVDSLQSPEGPLIVIMIGVNVLDASTADAFISEVAERFKMQRMTSPPDTNALLITLTGEISAVRFAQRWQGLVGADAILAQFMSQMRLADVMRGTTSGRALERVSLLEEAA